MSENSAPHPRPVVEREALINALSKKRCVQREDGEDGSWDFPTYDEALQIAEVVLALLPTEEGGGSAVCTCRTIAPSGWDTVQQVVNPRCPLHAEDSTKALVETGTKLGYELGRKEAGEQIAAAIIARRDADDSTREFRSGLGAGATIAANLFSQPNHAASAGLTGAPTSAGTPEDSKVGRIRIPAPDLTKGGPVSGRVIREVTLTSPIWNIGGGDLVDVPVDAKFLSLTAEQGGTIALWFECPINGVQSTEKRWFRYWRAGYALQGDDLTYLGTAAFGDAVEPVHVYEQPYPPKPQETA